MEELPAELRFVAQQKSASSMNGNSKNKCWTRARNSKSKGSLFPSYNEQLEIPNSSKEAMEFLCRSWSPSASAFLRTLSTSSAKGEKEEHEEKAEENLTQSFYSTSNNKQMTMLKQSLKGGNTLSSFLRSRKEKKKEDVRFHTSKLHVALSLAQLAAAVSSFVNNINGSGSTELSYEMGMGMDMGVAVASAAALMTTVWAEAAQVLGAQTSQVMSSINSGQAIRTPVDMLALTATAATCLRGAATLKSRALAKLSWSQEILKAGAQICTLMPSGQKEYKWVTVYLKQEELILSFKKKYLGGALTSSKEYKAINILEGTKEGQGCFSICLKTNKGMIKLLFQDEKQSTVWISTISKLLETYNRI